MVKQNRRSFLKTSAVGTAGIVAASSGVQEVLAKTAAVGFEDGAVINPKISNLRVVYIKDAAMLDGGTSASYGNHSAACGKAKADVIKANVDKMACALAYKLDPVEAWKTIFMKPDAKEWKDVKVGIKVNMLGDFQPLKATLSALCDGLKTAGVDLANIQVYDATKGGAGRCFNGFKDPVKVGSGSNGRFKSSMGYDANNICKEVDILISFVTNKCHQGWGKFTLNMKNHTGSLNKNWSDGSLCPEGQTALVKMGRCDAIMGNPGAGVPHKQQLAFIDSLFGSKNGDWGGGSDCAPCYLMMGTLAPVVDWACVKNIRETVMGVGGQDVSGMKTMFKGFGFTDADADLVLKAPAKTDALTGGWVDAAIGVAVQPRSFASAQTNSRAVELAVSAAGFSAASTRIALNHSSSISSVVINNMQGKLIRTLELAKGNGDRVVWDGLNNAGRSVRSGTYVVSIHSGSSVATGKITLSR
jgi:hypothetical protein